MKGKLQYDKFQKGDHLSFKGAILAQCYECNGSEEGGVDCLGVSCPLYEYMPYRKDRQKKQLTPEQNNEVTARFRRGKTVTFEAQNA